MSDIIEYRDEVAGDFVQVALAFQRHRVNLSNLDTQNMVSRRELSEYGASLTDHEHDLALAAWVRGIGLCESPIEKVLLPGLICQRYQFFNFNPCVLLPGETDKFKRGTMAVIPQLPIGRYRVDFALAGSIGDGPIKFVVVECDGKEFHDGIANVRRDVNRDVSILQNRRVLDVFRLDGREILRDPKGAAKRVGKAVLEAWRKK